MKKRGVVTFVFDDGYDDVYRLVVPLLEKYNFNGVFAIPLNSNNLEQETKQKMRFWQNWLLVTKNGHELASHSITHRDLTKIPVDQLEKELHEPADALHASTLIYPGGAHSDAVVAAAERFYMAARTVKAGFNTLPPHDPYRLHTYNFSKDNFSVVKANMLTIWAWLTNSWLIETYHLITDQPSELLHSTLLSDFERHVSFIKKLPVTVKTIRTVMEK